MTLSERRGFSNDMMTDEWSTQTMFLALKSTTLRCVVKDNEENSFLYIFCRCANFPGIIIIIIIIIVVIIIIIIN